MSKENVLYSVIGLLLGFMIGFFFANSVNQRGDALAPRTTGTAASLPSNGVAEQGGGMPGTGMSMQQVQDTIERARKDPNDFEAQVQAAQLFSQVRRFDGAIEFLQRANKLRPDDYQVVVLLGNTNFDAGRFEEAEKWYTEALKRKPNDVDVRTDLGLTFFFREPPDVDRAIAEYRRSLENNPSHEQTLHNFTVALIRKGDAEQAQAMLARLEKVNPNFPRLPELRNNIEKLRSSAKS